MSEIINNTPDTWNESEEFKKIITRLREIYKPINNYFTHFLAIKPGLIDTLEKLESVQKECEQFLIIARKQRIEKFGYIESDFVNSYRQSGKEIIDLGKGWGLKLIDIELNREAGTARCLYSDEPLGKWKKIASVEDIEKIIETGINTLEQTRKFIPDEKIVDIFWNAYCALAKNNDNKELSDKRKFFLYPDFFRELRIEAIRNLLSGKNPDIHLKSSDLSKVGFMYALDRYRLVSDSIIDKRLTIEVSTVAELKYAVKSRRLDMNDAGSMYSKIYFR